MNPPRGKPQGIIKFKKGNVCTGTTSPGGVSMAGTAVLSLGNGTVPVGGVANHASLYGHGCNRKLGIVCFR